VKTGPRFDSELIDIWGTTQKARRLLGFVPKVHLREGLTRYLDWRLEQASLD
jgi:nucleoside-diphosphate-sugar epimerase